MLAETLHINQEFLDACLGISRESPTYTPVFPTAVSRDKLLATDNDVPKMRRLTDNNPNAYSDFHGNNTHTACVFKSGPAWPVRTSWAFVREPRPVYGHPIAATWLSIGRRICDELDPMAVKWTCINPLAYANAGEAKPFCPLIISIGVTPGSLLYDTAVAAAAAEDPR